MRYVLGVACLERETEQYCEGIALVDKYGLYPYIGTKSGIEQKLDRDEEIRTIIYDDLESIQKTISDFSKRFRREGVSKPHQTWLKPKRSFRFYPIKVDSSNFPYKVGEKIPTRKQPMGQEKEDVFKLLKK